MPLLQINGREIHAEAGATVLEAAAAAGITIPSLCHHQDLSPVGSCRLCLVEVASASGQVAACTLPAEEGAVIRTETDELVESRRMILEMLLQDYVPPEHVAPGKVNELEQWAKHYAVQIGGSLLGHFPHPA